MFCQWDTGSCYGGSRYSLDQYLIQYLENIRLIGLTFTLQSKDEPEVRKLNYPRGIRLIPQ